jgi:hypothetical protein
MHKAQLSGQGRQPRSRASCMKPSAVATIGPSRALWWSTSPRMFSSPPAPTRHRGSGASTSKAIKPTLSGDIETISRGHRADGLSAKRPIVYSGGGVINSGPEASQLLREFVRTDRLPDHLDIDGAGRLSRVRSSNWMGMLGMHGTYEANMAMHDCDLMINASARALTTALPVGSMRFHQTRRKSTSTSTPPRSTRTCTTDIGIHRRHAAMSWRTSSV